MSTDARLNTGLPTHPKTKKLIRRLGPGAGWSLVCLILWARGNRPDGDLSGMSDEDIELACDWMGDNDAFVAALASVGYLDGESGSYQLHDWAEHQPWSNGSDLRSAKARWNAVKRHHGVAEADRQVPEWAAARASSIAGSTESDASSNARSNAAAMHAASSSNAPSPSPSPSQEQELSSSLRSDSSSSGADDPASVDVEKPELRLDPPADLPARHADRIAQVTQDAIETFNASRLTKPNGGLLATVSTTIGRERRQTQVKRCLRTARQICAGEYGGPQVVRKFWEDFWAACADDEFTSGRRVGGAGHESWKPDFEYLTREATMLKIYDRAVGEDAA